MIESPAPAMPLASDLPADLFAGEQKAAPDYLAALNDRQREAVLALDGPVLVLSGAGTGKTRVLTARLAHILAENRAWPSQILAVTFTNKAALEMKTRIAAILGRPVEGWWLGTFHALAARLLRQHAEIVGLKPNFTILDQDDQLRLLKQILQAENLDSQRWPARLVHGAIERWKDRGLGPDQVSPAELADLAGGRILNVYRLYQDRLLTLNACDFGDLLLHNLAIFRKSGEILARYQKQFRYLLVDEYQDTNVAQYLWLRALSGGAKNICCVGDDDQSVYGWRGAEVENILKFETDFPEARIIRLEQNYRSTPHILAAASGLIAHNVDRLGKTLWTERAEGERVRLIAAWDGGAEAREIADEIEAEQRKGARLGDMAILIRAGFQSREFEECFIERGLPYRVIGGPRFYERQEIRDALAYLRLVQQPDDDLAFERIVNLPRRGIGETSLRQLHELARAQGISLARAGARFIQSDEMKPAARRALGAFLADLARWRDFAGEKPHVELAETVLEESGYVALWRQDKSVEAPGRLENLKELLRALEDFPSLAAFLDHVALVMENAEAAPQDQVTLMTLHGAKGLEFEIIFLPGWEEGLFPHPRALEEKGMKGLEEERRLAYVGLTRARRLAVIAHAASRRIHHQWQNSLPSRFIAELPAEHIDRRDDRLFAREIRPNPRFPDLAPLRRDGASPLSPFAASSPETRRETMGAYPPGRRIFHQKFGYGRVIAADGDKLDIAFDKAGSKKVMASFVRPAEQAG